jgi:hypothetical protein
MQDGFEQTVGSWLIVSAKPIIQFIDPHVRELKRMVEAFEARGTHRASPSLNLLKARGTN